MYVSVWLRDCIVCLRKWNFSVCSLGPLPTKNISDCQSHVPSQRCKRKRCHTLTHSRGKNQSALRSKQKTLKKIWWGQKYFKRKNASCCAHCDLSYLEVSPFGCVRRYHEGCGVSSWWAFFFPIVKACEMWPFSFQRIWAATFMFFSLHWHVRNEKVFWKTLVLYISLI